jgi:hypothetical protein
MRLVSATGNTVRNAVCAARRALRVTLEDSPVIMQANHGDGLHRVQLGNGDVVEVTTGKGKASATIIDDDF